MTCCKSVISEARAFVSTGPFVIVDKDGEMSPELLLSEPQDHRDNIDSPPEDGLTVQIRPSDGVSNDIPELLPSTTNQESTQNNPTNEIALRFIEQKTDPSPFSLNLLTMVDGWPIPPHDNRVMVEEFPGKNRFERSAKLGTVDFSAPAEISVILVKSNPPELYDSAIEEESQEKKWMPAEMSENDLDRGDFNQMGQTDDAVMPEETNEVQPVIRSKLEFSKGADGSQTLSYEEEVKQHGGTAGRYGSDVRREPKPKGLRLTFLDLLRYPIF